jgi:polyhydroxybutyrate depolymerase
MIAAARFLNPPSLGFAPFVAGWLLASMAPAQPPGNAPKAGEANPSSAKKAAQVVAKDETAPPRRGKAARQSAGLGAGVSRSWKIRGEERTALIIAPAEPKEPAPVILAFHGHGGSGRGMVRAGFHRHWPEAIVVCPDGLPTKTPRDPEGLRPGWNAKADAEPNRDVEFTREILKTLKADFRIDERRIYATGHSNGAAFTYLLWATMGSELAAIAPSSAPAAGALKAGGTPKPIPILHLAGEADRIASYDLQRRTIERIRTEFKLDPEGKPWVKVGTITGTLYASKTSPGLVTLIHPGGHQLPEEFAELAVRFFKEHRRSP